MKKRYMLFIIIYLCLNLFIIPKSYCIEIYYPTKEELGGEIQIPNKEGTYDHYTNINTYEDLYSVLEDLSVEYTRLLEDYNSMESSYQSELHDKNIEIEELKTELDNNKIATKNENNNMTAIIISLIIVGIIVLYSKK